MSSTVRYGIRWDGRVRPKLLATTVAAFAALALCATPVAQGDSATTPDPGAGAANAAMEVVSGGSGVGPLAPAGTGVDVALIDSGVVPVGGLAGRVVDGPDFSDERRDRGLAALDWVRRHRFDGGLNIRVVNLSLGVEAAGSYRGDPLAWAVEQLWREGIAVVAAGGNNGVWARGLDVPAADPYVIAAGASDTRDTVSPADDRVADFSSRSSLRPVDVVAPGTRVVSLRVPGSALDLEFPGARVRSGFFRGSGSSQATAVVSGLAARLLSAHPELTPDQLKALLTAGAVDLPDPRSADGFGRVDLGRSLALPVPDDELVRQRWAPAVADGRACDRRDGGRRHWSRSCGDDRHPGADGTEWAGRRWSGRRWSGRRWSGRRWSGASWIVEPGG